VLRSSHGSFTHVRDRVGMALPPNISQRDLVRLALLICGERNDAKSAASVKGA